jgi:hypothetical protein
MLCCLDATCKFTGNKTDLAEKFYKKLEDDDFMTICKKKINDRIVNLKARENIYVSVLEKLRPDLQIDNLFDFYYSMNEHREEFRTHVIGFNELVM